MASIFIFCSLIFSQLLLLILVSAHNGNCPPSFECGDLGTIEFPFTTTQRPNCGLVAIRGCDDRHPGASQSVRLSNTPAATTWFNVVYMVQYNTIVIRDEHQQKQLKSKDCKVFSNNFTLPPTSPLASFHIKFNITMFRCNHSLSVTFPKLFHNYTNCADYNVYYGPPNTEIPPGFKWPSSLLAQCSTVELAVKGDSDTNDPFEFLSPEMVVEVRVSDDCNTCIIHERGQCQLDSQGKFYCAKGGRSWVVKMVLGLGLAVTIALVLVVTWLWYTRWKKQNPTHLLIDAILERQGPLQTKRYTYSEIKKVTNYFRNKLGEGGFGSVYKGKLLDGRYVAVKVLSELKGDGQDFINEILSISRTSHVNIVALLGFCFESSKRALVYEFMPNGSLEKFIFEENDLTVHRQLDCQTLYDIAIGVARGLEYLHKGCNTRILHFDIKPHNILLDENFCLKISDFGLAKICTRKESMVSIFGVRGTAGYITPEVFSRNFGTVSHKSDVYSYGMMVLEMVGRRKNINAEVECSSEIYFPHWIYNHLEPDQDLGLRGIRNERDREMVKKMTIVSLWCIQTRPSTRPGISQVVEMLEGRVDLLQMPPKPFWFSPSTSPLYYST